MKSTFLGISDARAAALIVFFLLCQMISISDAAPTPILPASRSMGVLKSLFWGNPPFPGSAKPRSPPIKITESGSQTVHKGDAPAPLPGSDVNPTLSSAHSGHGRAPQGHEPAPVNKDDLEDWVEVGHEKEHRPSSSSSHSSFHSASAAHDDDQDDFEKVQHSEVFDSPPFGFVGVTKKYASDAPPTGKPSHIAPTQHTKS
ncbi:hypothetical protein H0H93_014596 [Arthromyces matolae]|nr:hypothetical protein H0H93_014596 [Arthromyces matolae]